MKALPDRQIGYDVDAELRQISRRADARPQQDRRAPVGAGREDQLTCRDLSTACRDNAGRASLVEQNTIHEHIA